jgi:hypothetical protein
MNSKENNRKWPAALLGGIQIFVGIGAVPAGIVMIVDPSGSSLWMSVEMLRNSPFLNFLIPGIFLLVVNGILSLLASAASFERHRFAGEIAVGLGTFLILWIVIQVWWLGIHWLHFLYFGLGIVELVLGLMLRKTCALSTKSRVKAP